MREETFVCTSCGEEFPTSQRFEFDGQELCQHCLNEETVICHVCRERLWNDNNEGSDSTPPFVSTVMTAITRTASDAALCSGSRMPVTMPMTRMKKIHCARAATPAPPVRGRSRTTITSRNPSFTARAADSSVWSWRSTTAERVTAVQGPFWMLPTETGWSTFTVSMTAPWMTDLSL